MDRTDICPKCGNYTSGTPFISGERQLVKKVAKKGSAKIIGLAVGAVIGLFVGGPHASAICAVLGFVISFFFDSVTTEFSNEVENSFYETTQFNFQCPRCGHLWSKVFHFQDDTTTDAVLLSQKAAKVDTIRKQANNHWTKFGILGAIVFGCGYYCATHDRTYMTGEHLWGLISSREVTSDMWIFMMVLLVIFGLFAIQQLRIIFRIQNEADKVANMSVSEFRYSTYRY